MLLLYRPARLVPSCGDAIDGDGRDCRLGQLFLRVLQFFSPIAIPPLPLSPPHEVSDSPDQGAHFHVLGPKLQASSSRTHLADLLKTSLLLMVSLLLQRNLYRLGLN